jgi:hypothetical protein
LNRKLRCSCHDHCRASPSSAGEVTPSPPFLAVFCFSFFSSSSFVQLTYYRLLVHSIMTLAYLTSTSRDWIGGLLEMLCTASL